MPRNQVLIYGQWWGIAITHISPGKHLNVFYFPKSIPFNSREWIIILMKNDEYSISFKNDHFALTLAVRHAMNMYVSQWLQHIQSYLSVGKHLPWVNCKTKYRCFTIQEGCVYTLHFLYIAELVGSWKYISIHAAEMIAFIADIDP